MIASNAAPTIGPAGTPKLLTASANAPAALTTASFVSSKRCLIDRPKPLVLAALDVSSITTPAEPTTICSTPYSVISSSTSFSTVFVAKEASSNTNSEELVVKLAALSFPS